MFHDVEPSVLQRCEWLLRAGKQLACMCDLLVWVAVRDDRRGRVGGGGGK